MRILVGTLYTIENEFDECVAAIQSQTYRNFEHVVIKGLPNKEAHDTLYGSFMDRADEFDLMIKVDADMVIQSERLFSRIVQRFREENWLELLTIAVHDFFSDRLINGMHTYRNSVKWEVAPDVVFVDMSACTVPRERSVYDVRELAPAAIHCKNPSPFQSFHFGIHKGVKVVAARRQGSRRQLRYHCDNIERTWEHFLRRGDPRLGFASIGAALALRGHFGPEDLDYSNPYASSVFERYRGLDSEELRGMAAQLLPSARRFEIMRDGWMKFLARRLIPCGERSWLWSSRSE